MQSEHRTFNIQLPTSNGRQKGEAVGSHVADYLKEVDAGERTLKFWQEIYDGHGKLVEIHEKHPVDKGHQKV